MALGKGGMGGLLDALGGGKGAPGGEGMDAETSAMRDFAEAFAAKDYKGMAAAYKDAYRACSMGAGGGEEEPEGDEYPEA